MTSGVQQVLPNDCWNVTTVRRCDVASNCAWDDERNSCAAINTMGAVGTCDAATMTRVFFGNPTLGKTTVANTIRKMTNKRFVAAGEAPEQHEKSHQACENVCRLNPDCAAYSYSVDYGECHLSSKPTSQDRISGNPFRESFLSFDRIIVPCTLTTTTTLTTQTTPPMCAGGVWQMYFPSQQETKGRYQKGAGLAGRITIVAGGVICARMCFNKPKCKGFGYGSATKECVMYARVGVSGTLLTGTPQWSFRLKRKKCLALPTTDAPSTTDAAMHTTLRRTQCDVRNSAGKPGHMLCIKTQPYKSFCHWLPTEAYPDGQCISKTVSYPLSTQATQLPSVNCDVRNKATQLPAKTICTTKYKKWCTFVETPDFPLGQCVSRDEASAAPASTFAAPTLIDCDVRNKKTGAPAKIVCKTNSTYAEHCRFIKTTAYPSGQCVPRTATTTAQAAVATAPSIGPGQKYMNYCDVRNKAGKPARLVCTGDAAYTGLCHWKITQQHPNGQCVPRELGTMPKENLATQPSTAASQLDCNVLNKVTTPSCCCMFCLIRKHEEMSESRWPVLYF